MLTIRQPGRKDGHDDWLGPAPWIITPPPGPLAIATVARDENIISPSAARPYPLVIHRARGSIVEDVDGNRYLDFSASVAGCNTGHCHPIVVKSIEQQAQNLLHMSGSEFYYEPVIRLAEKLAEIVPGRYAKRVLFTDTGSEAVDAAIALARLHTHRTCIVAFQGASHGRAIPAPPSAPVNARRTADFGSCAGTVALAPYGDTAAVQAILDNQIAPDEVAAVLVEPILGEAGYVLPPQDFLPGLRRLCDNHGILLIADEIQSSLGQTGEMFACEHLGVVPDIACLGEGIASGMLIGAVIAPQAVMSDRESAHISAVGGNPVNCAAALATIELIEGHYRANAGHLGPIALEKLNSLADKFKCVARVRGLGLMIAFDVVQGRKKPIPDPDLRDRILREAFVHGLLLLGCGRSAIRVCPPLCINRTQLEVGLDVLDEVIATVAG